MLTQDDFAELTVLELLQHLWEYTNSFKNIEGAKYWLWLAMYKLYFEGHLREELRPCFPKLNFVLKRINELNIFYYPGTVIDSEKYMEFLTRVKDERKSIHSRLSW